MFRWGFVGCSKARDQLSIRVTVSGAPSDQRVLPLRRMRHGFCHAGQSNIGGRASRNRGLLNLKAKLPNMRGGLFVRLQPLSG